MIIGVPKEIKTKEKRVALTPVGAGVLARDGHSVLVQKDAGAGSGYSDEDYKESGALIIDNIKEIFDKSELILKIKEPIKEEYDYLRPNQILFTYLHLAANKELTKVLLKKEIIAFAYEAVEKDEKLPLLEPMSQIAGRMAAIVGANHLSNINEGEGVLLSGTTGVSKANVLVLGSGTVAKNAALIAAGMQANVTLIARNSAAMENIQESLDYKISTLCLNEENLKEMLAKTDLVISGILVKSAKTPVLITDEMLRSMKKGSVIVDVSIDQGGISSASRPTTHEEPVFSHNGVVHYCVANMPGAYAKTATLGITNATLPYITELAKKGWKKTINENSSMLRGVVIANNRLYNQAVADTFGLICHSLDEITD